MKPRLREYWLRFFATFRTRSAEVEEELRFHLDMAEQDALRCGGPVRQARLRLGGLSQASDAMGDQRTIGWLGEFLRDTRHGVRLLGKSPAFAAAAVLSLALGIGANTAIFSVVNAVLLRPLAYKDADRLVTLLHNADFPVAPANYLDWRRQSHSFEEMGAAEWWTPNLIGTDRPENLYGLRVTQTMLPLLGVQPLLGRLFLPSEDQTGSEHEVILSYGLWQRRFNGDRSVLETPITLDGEAYTIVGVMPPAFKFAPFWATRAELWAPLALGGRTQDRQTRSLRLFARLAPGVTMAQARAEIATITARLDQQYPGTNRDVAVTQLKEKVVRNVQLPLLVLMAAVGLVLLIACANVAHMLLARAANRQKEISLRAALGAGRGRVVRQFLAESLFLAAIGSGAGFFLARWGIRALIVLGPAGLPRLDTVSIDPRVVLFTLGITAITGLVCGLAPALQIPAANLTGALKEGERGSSERLGRYGMRSVLVASEFALALMLLIGAVLMIRSFAALQSIAPGFDSHNLLSMIVSVTGTQEDEPARRAIFYRQVIDRIRAVPGVRAAGGINHLPLDGDQWVFPFMIEGRPKPRPGELNPAVYRIVMPGYFETMRLPLLRGRNIQPSDDMHAPGVVVINEHAARRYWPAEDPIGKRIAVGDGKWLTIVGIAKDARQGAWAGEIYSEVYLAALQNGDFLGEPGSHASYITLVVRTAGDPAAMTAAVRDAVWSFDRNLPISEIVTMDQAIARQNAQPRFEMLLLGVFATIALLLAAVGIYGVMSYSVSRHTHEIGIRLSLGATLGNVLRMVVGQGMLLALAGSVAGLAGSLALSRLMKGLLYGVSPFDPLTFAVVTAVLYLVALLSSGIPALRATRIDPMTAMRVE
jgi:putative ABC transport system permease protein